MSLIHYLLLVFHWNACLFHLLFPEGFNGSSGGKTNNPSPWEHSNYPHLGKDKASPKKYRICWIWANIARLKKQPVYTIQVRKFSPRLMIFSFSLPLDEKGENDSFMTYLKSVYWTVLAMTTIGDIPWPKTQSEYLVHVAEDELLSCIECILVWCQKQCFFVSSLDL